MDLAAVIEALATLEAIANNGGPVRLIDNPAGTIVVIGDTDIGIGDEAPPAPIVLTLPADADRIIRAANTLA